MNAEYEVQTVGLTRKTVGPGTKAPASGPRLPSPELDGEMWPEWLESLVEAEPTASPLEDYVRELQQGFEEQEEGKR